MTDADVLKEIEAQRLLMIAVSTNQKDPRHRKDAKYMSGETVFGPRCALSAVSLSHQFWHCPADS